MKTVAKHLYQHGFYLSIHESSGNDDSREPNRKRRRIDNKPNPVKKEDYKNYKHVLPSARTITEYKQLQASQEERDSALALLNKETMVKVTLHFDTTSRNHIDGEWPSIILNFSDKQRFRLKPIFFAYENRENIIRLIVETLERLALAATICSNNPVSPIDPWKLSHA